MKSFFNRCIAMLLALMLVLPGAGSISLMASAAEPEPGAHSGAGGLFEILAENYFAGDGKAEAILTSGALLGDEVVEVNYPDGESGLVTLQDEILRVETTPSGYEGLLWTPYSYTLVNGGNETVKLFNGVFEVDLSAETYERVKVLYRLPFTNFEESDLLELVNLPSALSADADRQLSALNRLSTGSVYSSLGQLTSTILSLLGSILSTWTGFDSNGAKNAEMQAHFSGVIAQIRVNCLDTNNKLKLYNLLTEYKTGGLAYYYQNSEAFIRELALFSGYLNEMLADDEKIAALTTLENHPNFGAMIAPYVDRIVDMKDILAEVQADLVAPNAAIDPESGNLDALVAALQLSGTPAFFESLPAGLALETAIEIAAEKNANLRITLVLGGKSVDLSYTFSKEAVITAADVEAVLAAIDAAVTDSGIPVRHYDTSYDGGDALMELVGTQLRRSENLTYTWTPRQYTVHIDGEADQYVSADGLRITLPAAPAANCRYDYDIGGRTVAQGSYTFTLEELDRLFADGSCTLTRTLVNLVAEELDRFLAQLNQQGGDSASYSLNEDRTELTATLNDDSGLMLLLMSLVNSDYSRIEIGSEPLIYTVDGVQEISLQALVDAIVAAGITSQDIIDGKGSLTVDSTLKLTKGDMEIDLIFHLTLASGLEDLASDLEMAQDVMTFYCEDGVVKVNIDLPEGLYELYMDTLMLSGNADIRDINKVESAVAHSFLNGYIDILLGDGVTAETYANTLNDPDSEEYLAGLDAALEQLRGLTYDEETYSLTLVISREELETRLSENMSPDQLQLVSGMIKELKDPNGQVTLDMTTNILDFADEDGDGYADRNNDFEALIVDVNALAAAGGSPYQLTADLAQTLAGYTAPSAVILQQDITGDLVFAAGAILDLNGHTVAGSITANDSLVIVDSSMDTLSCGSVTGAISGGSVTIMAGRYDGDVTAYLGEGYVQVGGTVFNELYTVSVDEQGNITFLVDPAFLGDPALTDSVVKALSAELCGDLLMNYFTASALSFGEGMDIYEMSLIGLVDGSSAAASMAVGALNYSGISAFVNSLMADLTDYGAIARHLAAGEPVASYVMSTRYWDLILRHNGEEDRFEIDMVAAAEVGRSVGVNVDLAGDAEANIALAVGLSGIISSDTEIGLDSVTVLGSDLLAEGTVSAQVTVDFTANPDHAAILGAALAAGGVNSAELAAALNEYFAGAASVVLLPALEKVTVSQLVTVLEGLSAQTELSALFTAAGVAVGTDRVAALETVYPQFLVAGDWMTLYLSNADGSAALADLAAGGEAPGTYVVESDNVIHSGSYPVSGGYGVRYEMTAERVVLTMKLLGGKPAVEPPVISGSDSIYSAVVDSEDFVLYLDAVTAGITVEELQSLLTAQVTNDADGRVEITVTGSVTQGDRTLVPTGAQVTLTAAGAGGMSASLTYTVVLLGDTNCNGRIENNDNVLIARHFVGTYSLSGLAVEAADVNRNGRLDNNDAVLNSIKFVRPGDYDTKLS